LESAGCDAEPTRRPSAASQLSAAPAGKSALEDGFGATFHSMGLHGARNAAQCAWSQRFSIFSREKCMATYILLGTFTDQGIRHIKDTTKRADAVRAMGKKIGVSVQEMYWTLGQYDVAAILDAPNEAATTSLALSVGALGNVRTQLLRAFTQEEIGPILGRMAKSRGGQK
jgi:uncharacterized protein with GYD domain